ncbi:hypothetical protein [Kitasatospora sp. NPDC058184]|uniref:hypothetical protein n=1 Tax=unclassified Kitasatospora TaxID=2633591 RepID=UPI0036DA691E
MPGKEGAPGGRDRRARRLHTIRSAPLADDWYTQWKDTTADPDAPVKETRPKLTWCSDQDVLWRGSIRTPEIILADGLRPQGEKTSEDQRQYNWVSPNGSA